jgi:hypothetical protein
MTMAHDAAVHLTALCAVLSFFWLSNSVEKHELMERPRLSSVFVLAIAGALCFGAGHFSSWLPGGDGRFDKDDALKHTKQPTPKRPRRFFFPVIVVCILLRLELFYYTSSQQQCTSAGVESFLCLLLVCYEAYSIRRPRAIPLEDEEDDNDPWGSVTDDIRRFFSGHTATIANFVAVLALCDGTFLTVSSHAARSTYFCSSVLDSAGLVLFAQVLGLFLDAAIVLLVWRVLAWAKTTKIRLSTLGSALLVSAIAAAFIIMCTRMFGKALPGGPTNSISGGLDSLYLFDIAMDGAAFGVLAIATSLVMCETTPTTPASVMTLVIGVSQALHNIKAVGDWQHLSRLEAVLPLYLCTTGFITHLYVHGTRSVVFMRRAFLTFCLFCLAIYAIIIALSRPTSITGKHPLNKMIYDARIAHDHWLHKATMSMRPEVAADEYRRRNHGRDPPINFDNWFQYAKNNKSPIMDAFDQISKDMLPFWGLEPAAIRERTEWALDSDFAAAVTIKDHKVTHDAVSDTSNQEMLAQLVSMIEEFAEYLPDMVVPINLSPRPRVLATWDEKQHLTSRATDRNSRFHSQRSLVLDSVGANSTLTNLATRVPAMSNHQDPKHWLMTSPNDFHHIEALACPPDTRSRAAAAWNVRDTCEACSGPNTQFVTRWPAALDTCSQPDLFHLHGFYMRYPSYPAPYRQLVPLFSVAKTTPFSDILFPLPEPAAARREDRDGWKEFSGRSNSLYWRAAVDPNGAGKANLRGNHVHRLLHMVNNASHSDTATILIPLSARSSNQFAYTPMTLRAAMAALPLDMALDNYHPCYAEASSASIHGSCSPTTLELGPSLSSSSSSNSSSSSSSTSSPIHDHRFILTIDTDSSPPESFISVLRSSSAPVLATIFTTWSTDRLAPWVHFIPLDLRFHGFHSTAAYFLGMRGQDATRQEMIEPHDMGSSIGKNPRVVGDAEDGEWIAGQGKAWAARALREQDKSVYLFRLLLEWGRVTSDGRDSGGYQGTL